MNCFTANAPLPIIHHTRPPKPKPTSQKPARPPAVPARDIDVSYDQLTKEDAQLTSWRAITSSKLPPEPTEQEFMGSRTMAYDMPAQTQKSHMTKPPTFSTPLATGFDLGVQLFDHLFIILTEPSLKRFNHVQQLRRRSFQFIPKFAFFYANDEVIFTE